jgi:hypothetical protein
MRHGTVLLVCLLLVCLCSCFPGMARRRVWQYNTRERERQYLSLLSGQALATGSGQASARDMAHLLVAIAPAHLATPQRKLARAQARSEDLFQTCIPDALLALPGAACGAAAGASACGAAAAAPCPSCTLAPSLSHFKDKEGGHGASLYSGVRICVCMYHPRQPIHDSWALLCTLSYCQAAAHTPGSQWVRLLEQTGLGSDLMFTLQCEQSKC